MTYKFRPQEFNGKFKLKYRNIGQYHWCQRQNISNHRERVGAQLHYLAGHAPIKIALRWMPIAHRFFTRYKKL
jgi:hypothetical protein